MTEAEALDEAAKATGWGSWEYAETHCDPGERWAIHAHAKALMENAALKEQLAIAREALKVYAGWDGKTARTALERIGDD